MRYIVLDTETTGLDPGEGHRIVEVAALELEERHLTRDYRHYYINPGRASDEAALKVHGLTDEFLQDKPRFADIAQEFLHYIEGATLIIHNAPFDMAFLNSEVERLNLGKMDDYIVEVIDTLVMAKDIYPGKRNSLDALCDRLEIDRSARVLHGALIDCELLAEVYFAMTRGQDSLLMEYREERPVDFLRPMDVGKPANARAFPIYYPTPAELEAHNAYLDLLDKAVKDKCVWRSIDEGA